MRSRIWKRVVLGLAVLMSTSACGNSQEAAANGDDAGGSAAIQSSAIADADAPTTDFLSFAQGAMPVAIGGDADVLNVNMEQALRTIDGDMGGFSATPKPGGTESEVWFVYRLPAATIFTRFAVPNVLETPSPSQTFFKEVEVLGGNDGPDGAFETLGSVTLAAHAGRDEQTYFDAVAEKPVGWVKVRLSGGINVEREQTYFEFSEMIGEGRQEPVAMSSAFTGKWSARGVELELKQDGTSVTGCYDGVGDLQGDVSGNLLRASGTNRNSGVRSAFVLSVVDGEIVGVRSTNGAPFKLYSGAADADLETECSAREVAPPGCGDTLYGIQFDFDSAAIRRESDPVLDALHDGLAGADGAAITIVGHTSSEGSDNYNLDLSQRRAEAVVAALVERGLDAGELSARGAGEAEPVADNVTETGRSLNRRVEITCS